MWNSYWDGYSRAPLRIGLATIAAIEFAVEAWAVATMAADPAHFPATAGLSQLLAGLPGLAWVIYGAVLLGLLALATDRRPIIGTFWALLCMVLLSQWQTQLFGSPSRNSFFPGAALLGWAIGSAWAHAQQQDSSPRSTTAARVFRQRLAEAGALACIAAAYVGSGTSKLISAGASWGDASQVRALILWQSPVATWGWLLDYRQTLLMSPGYARAAAIATLCIEIGGVFLLFGRRLRLLSALAIIAMHVNIILLCTMPYLEPMALLLLFALPWPQLLGSAKLPRTAALDPKNGTPPRSIITALLLLIVLAWLLAPFGWRG
ncbi:MAG TPA: hypothetical protein ENJ18_01135 [Nannocystis exedens]|nr:hypothetical protein [Nannocystis exedens]